MIISPREILRAMAILKVARMGHPGTAARAKALESADIKSPAIQQLIDDMFETMQEYQGVGPRRAAGARERRGSSSPASRRADDERTTTTTKRPCPADGAHQPRDHAVVGAETADDWEGCLSIPDIRGRVPRAREIEVERAYDRRGTADRDHRARLHRARDPARDRSPRRRAVPRSDARRSRR